MISILIPVFGESVDEQLAIISREIESLNYTVEVIVCDDYSQNVCRPSKINYEVMPFRFIELDKNLGRSKIRNFLASQAKYEHLIFIDANCLPISPVFINTYKLEFNPNSITIGGQLFSDKAPLNKYFQLRWLYGTKVESIKLKDRKLKPYMSFMANNFSISKTLITMYPFDNEHSGYGHEDSLFVRQIQNNGVGVNHINNLVRHLDNESNQVFLSKTIEGVNNLALSYRAGKLDNHVRLIKGYELFELLAWTGLSRVIEKYIIKKGNLYYIDLLEGSSNLNKFSLFKLSVFIIEINRLDSI